MGYRTHLTLEQVIGKKTEVIEMKLIINTEIRKWLDDYCIGNIYIDETPEIIKEALGENEIYIHRSEYSDDAEMNVGDFIFMLKKCKENKLEEGDQAEFKGIEWLRKDWTELIEHLELLLRNEKTTEDNYIKFTCY
jgi:hypothetical protein